MVLGLVLMVTVTLSAARSNFSRTQQKKFFFPIMPLDSSLASNHSLLYRALNIKSISSVGLKELIQRGYPKNIGIIFTITKSIIEVMQLYVP